jgi:HEAT repeat protein
MASRLSIHVIATCLTILYMGTLGACAPKASEGGFNSANPAAKLYAIVEAGRQRDTAAIPHLIEQLDSDDPAVRLYTIIALERITGTRLDYSPYDPPALRTAAQRRWYEQYQAGELTRSDSPSVTAEASPSSAVGQGCQ